MDHPLPRRHRLPLRTLVVAALIAALRAPALANDFEAYGIGSALAPVAASRIQLLIERVTLTEMAHDWQADAVYVFRNPTAEPIATTFAFPEGCPQVGDGSGEDDERYENPQFRDLVTLVRGAPVPTRLLEAQPWPGLALCLGRVHAFDLTLAPAERVEVRHRYSFSTSGGIGFEEVDYITRSGALWDGPIGTAEFIIAPRTVPFGISWPAGLNFGFL